MNLFDLTGKNAFVIGAGGIGSAIAKGLAWQGARIVVADINEKNAAKVASEIRAEGGKCDVLVADISTKADVEAMFARVDGYFDRLDILINAAGIGAYASAFDMTEDIWRAVLGHFLDSVFWCCREGGLRMAKTGGGKIVNICSMSGTTVTQSESGSTGSPYAAAKAGLIQLTKALAVEWIGKGIFVNGISPGMVRTALTAGMFDNNPKAVADMNALIPLGRIAQPIDIVGPAIFLSSAASDYVIGQNLLVDGGYTLR